MNDFVLNEEMTEAVLEKCKEELKIKEKIEKNDGDLLAAIFGEREVDRFYGTVVNEEKIKTLKQANALLDIINTSDDVTVEKFEDPCPLCPSESVIINVPNGFGMFNGAVYRAFRRLTKIADDFMVMWRGERSVRMVFNFKDVWLEHREMTDEEMEEYNNMEDTEND